MVFLPLVTFEFNCKIESNIFQIKQVLKIKKLRLEHHKQKSYIKISSKISLIIYF